MTRDRGKHRPFTGHYEVRGNPLSRQVWIWVRMKTSIIGNFDTGPGLKNLVTLWLVHRIGRPLFHARTWIRNRHGLRGVVRRILGGRRPSNTGNP